MRGFSGRVVKFVAVGGVTTAFNFAAFLSLVRVVHYEIANVIAWSLTIGAGFLLNRRFTFEVTGRDGRYRHLMLYVVGAILQLGVASLGLWVLMGRLHLSAVEALVPNLIATTAFSFAFQNLVTFRRAASPP